VTAGKSDDVDIAARAAPWVATLGALAFVGAPLAMLLYAAFRGPADFLPFESGAQWTFENVAGVFLDPVLGTRIIPQTLIFVGGVVSLTLTLAFALAWLIERCDTPGRGAWHGLIVFPLLVPIPVIAIAWIIMFGPNAGWANIGLRAMTGASGPGPLNIFSMTGLIVCQSFVTTPFVFLQISSTLRSMAPALEESAMMSGAGALAVFRRVTLPILRPGLLAPLILVTLITFEQFELPLIIGLPARINIFAYRIYNELTPSSGLPNYGAACAISLPFLAFGLIALSLYNRATRRAERFVTITGKGFSQRKLALGRWRWPSLLFLCAYALLGAGLPLGALLWTSLFGFTPPGRARLADANFSAYATFLRDPVFWRAAANTFLVAGASALIVTALGGLIAWVVARSKWRWRQALDALSFMSLGIPAVIAALAAMVLFLSLPIGIYGTVWILIFAYSYRLATSTRLTRASLTQLHPELEEAASMSGARWLATQIRVLIPLLLPTLSSAFLVIFIIGLREFTIPFVLNSPDNLVLPVLVWQLFQSGQPAPSAALGTIMILIALPMILMARMVGSRA
jgi:iron(III) transport system permease protein